ncbi:YqjF family protein [Natribacillus halophilus]|uniref:DUF2071 domain-containing protein n=1 Tax=Natribacillus halophilus TaxID=549003 RepID=A0A1G8L2F8_9BACI|nr:DUF2071 domain-containing protein [Natribacillus halophilus]SDI49340.1 hypothetical protein SAMN04488123_102425 [Natribacillus halophilus]
MFKRTLHRPFPLPDEPWLMTQTWKEVLFAHWPVSPEYLQTKIPDPLEIDTFDRQAWIGIIPFDLVQLRAHFLPPVPFAHSFPEINVRTYVTFNGQPGVYFFSLSAAHRPAVFAARTFFHLPYDYADIKVKKNKETTDYRSVREDNGFEATYQPASPIYTAGKQTLDHWLTERYRLYTTHKNKLYALDIHHVPWPLQQAEANIHVNTIAAGQGLSLPDTKPLLHYARKQKVFFWPLHRCT